MSTLPVEIITKIIRYLNAEDQLKVLENCPILLQNIGLPKTVQGKDKAATLRLILNIAGKHKLFHVLEYILLTEPNLAKSVLFKASQTGNLELVEKVLSFALKQSIGLGIAYNWAAYFAVQEGHFHIFERLVSLVETRDKKSLRPLNYALHLAAEKDYIAIVERLLLIDGVDVTDTSVIHAAIQNRSFGLVEKMLEIPEVFDCNFHNVFHWAARYGHLDFMEKIFYRHRENVSEFNYNYAAREAIQNGHLATLERLMEIAPIRILLTSEFLRAIERAAANGHFDIIERLLQIPFIYQEIGKTSVFNEAAMNGHVAIVDRLLQFPGVNVKDFDIIIAARNGHLEVLKRLCQVPELEKAAGRFHLAIHFAAENGHLDVVEELLVVSGVELSKQQLEFIEFQREIIDLKNDNTNVSIAEIVERLLKDPNTNVELCSLALEVAAGKGHLEIVERLLQIPGISEKFLSNAFLNAAQNGHLAVVERLLVHPNMASLSKSNFSFRCAAVNGHLAVVERLLEIPIFKDDKLYCRFALESAGENGHLDIVDRLLQVPGVEETFLNVSYIRHVFSNGRHDITERFLEIPGYL